jgi:hypothetical protein
MLPERKSKDVPEPDVRRDYRAGLLDRVPKDIFVGGAAQTDVANVYRVKPRIAEPRSE